MEGLVNSPYNERRPALSRDELTLYFASTRPETPDDLVLDFNISVSKRVTRQDAWGEPIELEALNSAGEENTGNLSPDGHLLFIQSNRPGSTPTVPTDPDSTLSNDIWVSRLVNPNDYLSWGEPTRLGGGVNTEYNEGTPFY